MLLLSVYCFCFIEKSSQIVKHFSLLKPFFCQENMMWNKIYFFYLYNIFSHENVFENAQWRKSGLN